MLVNEHTTEYRNGRWRTIFRWWRVTPQGCYLISEMVL